MPFRNFQKNESGNAKLIIMAKKHDVVQVKNPRSGHYVKIDRTAGKIVSHKKSDGPYKDIPVARRKK